jgi:DNA mismatch repair ATPase MutS
MNQLEGEAIASANEGFELIFSTEKTCYFKNDRMKQLDAELGDINSEIGDIEIEIIQELVNAIQQHEEQLKICSLWLSTIDW